MNTNDRIRAIARANGIPLWLIADALGISESTMTRKLRKPLTTLEYDAIVSAIKEVAANYVGKFYDDSICSIRGIEGGDVNAED